MTPVFTLILFFISYDMVDAVAVDWDHEDDRVLAWRPTPTKNNARAKAK